MQRANLSLIGALGLAVGIIYLVHHSQQADRQVTSTVCPITHTHTHNTESTTRGTERSGATAKETSEQETVGRTNTTTLTINYKRQII